MQEVDDGKFGAKWSGCRHQDPVGHVAIEGRAMKSDIAERDVWDEAGMVGIGLGSSPVTSEQKNRAKADRWSPAQLPQTANDQPWLTTHCPHRFGSNAKSTSPSR